MANLETALQKYERLDSVNKEKIKNKLIKIQNKIKPPTKIRQTFWLVKQFFGSDRKALERTYYDKETAIALDDFKVKLDSYEKKVKHLEQIYYKMEGDISQAEKQKKELEDRLKPFELDMRFLGHTGEENPVYKRIPTYDLSFWIDNLRDALDDEDFNLPPDCF